MTTDASGPTRRTVMKAGLAVATTASVAGALGSSPASAAAAVTATSGKESKIYPFRVDVSGSRLTELRHRLGSTRWPSRELVKDRSQGVQLAANQAVAKYWANKYDWRRFEAKINALPQFKTEIDGLGIHFIHVKSKHKDALPLILTHGWPGSIIEFLDAIAPLTDPTRFGGKAEDAFHVVIPSIPGFGFSDQPGETGWDAGRTAAAWATLMGRLGYTKWVAQGGDVGAAVTDGLGRLAPAGLAGIHLNLFLFGLTDLPVPQDTAEEKAAFAAALDFKTTGSAYTKEQGYRPETIGYALSDSPSALAAWMLDHDTDSYTKIAKAFTGGPATGNLTRDHVLDNISLYWLTNTGVSGSRIYWESNHPAAGGGGSVPGISVPVAFSAFPGELFQAPKSWVAAYYPTLGYYNQPAKGGHFAAWEEPELFAAELRAAFRSVR